MKAITVRQPWAWAIVHAGKDVENRTRNIAGSYRGPVIIHASKSIGAAYVTEALAWMSERRLLTHEVLERFGEMLLTPGSALGVVDVVGSHVSRMSFTAERYGKPVCFDDHTPIGSLCSPWAQFDEIGIAHLALANPRPFPEPIPYRGALGLWEFPDELLPDGWLS